MTSNNDAMGKYPDILLSVILFDPITGVLTWGDKPRSLFKSDSGFKAYNTKYKGAAIANEDTSGYIQVKVSGVNYVGHRIAWALHYGSYPNGQIDHINHIRNDNRIVNLRDVSRFSF